MRSVCILKIAAYAMLAVAPSLSIAQGYNLAKDLSPEYMAKSAEAVRLTEEGNALLKKDKASEAISLFLHALSLDPGRQPALATLDGLARAYTKTEQFEEARQTYKRATLWLRDKGRIVADIDMLMDYAVLLAKTGHPVEAKAAYYEGLRAVNPKGEVLKEPIPLRAVFDADPDADVRPYSPSNLEAAALMVKAINTEDSSYLERIRSLAPDWNYPVLYGIVRLPKIAGVAEVDRALASAKADRERADLRDLRERAENDYDAVFRGDVRSRLESIRNASELLKTKGGDIGTPMK
ncbi:tetratricopeptide repeat protein [bacterium]|nr:MAG: tetratricopeptide repeat protein [bacterium]